MVCYHKEVFGMGMIGSLLLVVGLFIFGEVIEELVNKIRRFFK